MTNPKELIQKFIDKGLDPKTLDRRTLGIVSEILEDENRTKVKVARSSELSVSESYMMSGEMMAAGQYSNVVFSLWCMAR